MRKFSRHMPPAPTRKLPPLAWLFFAILLTAFALMAWNYPVIICLWTLLIVASVVFDSWRKQRMIEWRAGESICQFARSFDYRKTDTRIIRAVYEEVGRFLGTKDRLFPLRAADTLFSDDGLKLDLEDLDLIAEDIAFRAGRSLCDAEHNPYFGRITTVADLVAFFMAQPETSPA